MVENRFIEKHVNVFKKRKKDVCIKSSMKRKGFLAATMKDLLESLPLYASVSPFI